MTLSETCRTALLGIAAGISAATADVVRLDAGNSSLHGEILAIGKDRTIAFQSPLSPTPLKLKLDLLDAAEFTHDAPPPEPSPIIVTLANGDMLPANRILTTDATAVGVDSPVAGDIQVPRTAIESIRFGIHPNRILFGSNDPMSDWTDQMEERENWRISKEALVAHGKATATHTLDLPADFSVSLTLEWRQGEQPDMRLLMTETPGKPANRYLLAVNRSGIQVMRENSATAKPHMLCQLLRLPSQFPDNKMRVEIRVLRSNQLLGLWVDGHEEARIADPIGDIPTGNTLTLQCNNPSGTQQTISEVIVSEFNHTNERPFAEDRGNPNADVILTRDEDRWTGQLLAITPSAEGNLLIFKSDFREQPLEIPQREVATLRFALTGDGQNQTPAAPMMVKLVGRGVLHATDCTLGDGTLAIKHPLLGTIPLATSHVASLARSSATAQPASP